MRYNGGADLSGMQFSMTASVSIRSVVLNHASEQLIFTEKELKTKLAT